MGPPAALSDAPRRRRLDWSNALVSRLGDTGADQLVAGVVRRLGAREDVQFILHCLFLLALMVLVRPMFTRVVPPSSYEAPSIWWHLVSSDVALLVDAARTLRPAVPNILFLLVPTVLFLLGGRRVTWQSWTHGRSLRAFVMALLLMLTWSGATFDYNHYLGLGHAFDRLILVAFTALSWWTPLAVPFATKWAIVMIKEAYVPIPLDDFDFRSVPEVLIVFSCFVWSSFRRTFVPKHFLLVGLGCWASYYFAAGVAKWRYGAEWSWLLHNHLSNLSVAGYVRGWLGFVPEDVFLAANAVARRLDRAMAAYTMVLELGSLVFFFVHPRVTRVWLCLCFVLNLGIFALTGICFWKWMFANAAFWLFLRKGGAPILKEMCRPKLVMLFAVSMVYFSLSRIWFFPQLGVAWYDSRLVENYVIQAVGRSGQSYIVSPRWLTPMEMHWVQGRLCYATRERSITGIYGTCGSLGTVMALERLRSPQEALRLLARGRSCTDATRQETFNAFFIRYFGNLNRHGRRHRWLEWVGRPTHLWVHPRGNLYDMQEPVARIELWREVVLHHADALHRLETKKVHTVVIPP